jgi:hypothetical protein
MSTIKHSSSQGRQQAMVQKAAEFIEKTKEVHRFALMYFLKLTVSQMNQLHPFLEYGLQDKAIYDKASKTWTVIDNEVTS